jgi:hypothetical protein
VGGENVHQYFGSPCVGRANPGPKPNKPYEQTGMLRSHLTKSVKSVVQTAGKRGPKSMVSNITSHTATKIRTHHQLKHNPKSIVSDKHNVSHVQVSINDQLTWGKMF